MLGIGYRCQFTPQHIEAIRFSREEVFGRLRQIEASFGFRIGDPNQWRLKHALAGGGALMDVGIYALQACRYLTGEEPLEVMAQEVKTDPVKFREVDESIQWMMKFPSGATANCATTYAYQGMNRFTAYGDDGKFGIEPAYSYRGLKGWTSKEGVAFPDRQVDHFAAEIDAFSMAILNGAKDFKVPGEEGLKDLLAIEAIYRSIREGKAVQV
jgi:predicted dehydrogenase